MKINTIIRQGDNIITLTDKFRENLPKNVNDKPQIYQDKDAVYIHITCDVQLFSIQNQLTDKKCLLILITEIKIITL